MTGLGAAGAAARDLDGAHRTHANLFVEHEDSAEVAVDAHRGSVAQTVARWGGFATMKRLWTEYQSWWESERAWSLAALARLSLRNCLRVRVGRLARLRPKRCAASLMFSSASATRCAHRRRRRCRASRPQRQRWRRCSRRRSSFATARPPSARGPTMNQRVGRRPSRNSAACARSFPSGRRISMSSGRFLLAPSRR